MKYQYILFDLDGTIINSSKGVTNSVQYALNKVGIAENNISNLTRFIGPPLEHSFTEFYSLKEEKIQEAITHFRDNYSTKGIMENELYDGIVNVLKTLKENGASIGIATGKPTVYAKKIVKELELDKYIDALVGSNLDGSQHDKGEVMQLALQDMNAESDANVLMIGDRLFDIIGAKNCKVDSIAVLYGFGSQKELENENPTYIVDKPVEILDIVFDSKAS